LTCPTPRVIFYPEEKARPSPDDHAAYDSPPTNSPPRRSPRCPPRRRPLSPAVST
jgi:hypothetical protein